MNMWVKKAQFEVDQKIKDIVEEVVDEALFERVVGAYNLQSGAFGDTVRLNDIKEKLGEILQKFVEGNQPLKEVNK